MVQEGLKQTGNLEDLQELAEKYHRACVADYQNQKTLRENMAPDKILGCGQPDFVGWAGIGPVANLIEYILGFEIDAPGKIITWTVRQNERHGLTNLRFNDFKVDLIAEPATGSGPRQITVESGGEFTLRLRRGTRSSRNGSSPESGRWKSNESSAQGATRPYDQHRRRRDCPTSGARHPLLPPAWQPHRAQLAKGTDSFVRSPFSSTAADLVGQLHRVFGDRHPELAVEVGRKRGDGRLARTGDRRGGSCLGYIAILVDHEPVAAAHGRDSYREVQRLAGLHVRRWKPEKIDAADAKRGRLISGVAAVEVAELNSVGLPAAVPRPATSRTQAVSCRRTRAPPFRGRSRFPR